MKTFNYTITDEMGLHARPAGLLVKEAQKYKSDITVKKGSKSGSAKRIFSIMGIGISKGDNVTFSVNGSDEDYAVIQLEDFCKKNL